jgi:hypothetical protein
LDISIRPPVGGPISGRFAESDAEEAALGWLETLGYTVRHGPEIAYNIDGGERTDPGYHVTILQNRLDWALTRLNPGLPAAVVGDAYRKLLRVEAPNLLASSTSSDLGAAGSMISLSPSLRITASSPGSSNSRVFVPPDCGRF